MDGNHRGKRTYLSLDSFLIFCHLSIQTVSEATDFARVHLHYFSVKVFLGIKMIAILLSEM